jgi:hypothetical protein
VNIQQPKPKNEAEVSTYKIPAQNAVPKNSEYFSY